MKEIDPEEIEELFMRSDNKELWERLEESVRQNPYV